MYRKPRGGGSQSILNLDSLMDILSCLVGVMLFLVIYTVLELGAGHGQVGQALGERGQLRTCEASGLTPLRTLRALARAHGPGRLSR